MAKRPLVAKHLENLSRATVEQYQAIIRDYVRGCSGIYALYRRERLYYVGLASNLHTRLKQHLKDRHGSSWDRFSVYLTKRDQHLRELESLVLRIVKPNGNRNLGKLTRSENLSKRLKRDLNLHHRRLMSDLLGTPLRGRRVAKGVASEANGKAPILAQFVKSRMPLRARHKGAVLKASVLASGMVRFDGTRYDSPSLAAAAASGRTKCNGWGFWYYKNKSGEWVRLREIKKKRRRRAQ